MKQHIRFCTAPDGVRIAYATSGSGPPLVKTANWLTHLENDWESPIWRHMFTELSRDHLLLRYDDRGNGLSDWDAADISFDAWVRDLETVVDAAGLERFALLGISRGGAVSIEYATRHPERVSHLILLGGYCMGGSRRSDAKDVALRDAMVTLMAEGWGRDNPAFHQVWTSLFIPDSTLEHQHAFNELQRITTSPQNAVRMQQASMVIDVHQRLAELRVPTLVCHSRGDAVVTFEHGRRMAAAIPNAAFVPLESRNHLLLEHEPAFQVFLTRFRQFLGTESETPEEDARDEAGLAGVDTPVQLATGSTLAHYRVIAPLGRGGMGLVYRAKDTRLGREVALKVLAPAVATGDRARRWLLREARHAAVLNHPNICTVFDVLEAGGRDLIVMELVSGTPLPVLLAENQITVDRLRRFGAQIADALDHAHSQGVIHGDLKSANIIVTERDQVKVLDFGVSRRLPVEGRESVTDLSLASAGMIGGTPAYMSPELLQGDPGDTRSDLWSLGVLLFEMATGHVPFAGQTLYELMNDIVQRQPTLPEGCVPADVEAVIDRCLEKDPNRRFQRGAAIRDALTTVQVR